MRKNHIERVLVIGSSLFFVGWRGFWKGCSGIGFSLGIMNTKVNYGCILLLRCLNLVIVGSWIREILVELLEVLLCYIRKKSVCRRFSIERAIIWTVGCCPLICCYLFLCHALVNLKRIVSFTVQNGCFRLMIGVVRFVTRMLLIALNSLIKGSMINWCLKLGWDFVNLNRGILDVLYCHLKDLLRYPLSLNFLWMTFLYLFLRLKPSAWRHLFDYLRYVLIDNDIKECLLRLWKLFLSLHERKPVFFVDFRFRKLLFDLLLEVN